jgi:hypothetical protein
LEQVSDKYDREKRELLLRLEKDRDEALRRMEAKYEGKLQSLKSLNESMGRKLTKFDET